jgi:demethylmenaquinone methyltransferase/2-methoxy-6-polyprenyl-1,4-benzoquinol methylase
MKKNLNKISRKSIIDKYYSEIYDNYLNDDGLIRIANRTLERKIEHNSNKQDNYVLEIGGGGGEHLKFVSNFPQKNYIILDPRGTSKTTVRKLKKLSSKIKFVSGVAEDIPFPNCYFDRIVSSCVLAHLDDPLASLLECRRVTKENGTLSFLVTTDPGFLNQLVKKIYSYPKLNKLSEYPANLIYALDHKNGVINLLSIIRYVFKNDSIKLNYYPFFIPSVNFNLAVIVNITKSA